MTCINNRSFIIIPLFFLLIIFGCFGPKKMNKWIASEYGETIDLNKNRTEYISISSPLITSDARASTAAKRTKSFLPMIFYWKWAFELSGTLNPKIPINLFTSTFTTYANTKGLRQKLDGAKLEMSINKIPVTFSYNDDNKLFYLILFYVHSQKLYYEPQVSDMVISYKVLKNNSASKAGVLNIPDANKIKNMRFLQSAKKAAQEYMQQYDDNIRAMAKAAVDKLISEL